MYLRIDGLNRGDLESVVAVVALTGGRTDVAASKNGAGTGGAGAEVVGPDGLVVWLPGAQGDLVATIIDDVIGPDGMVEDAITHDTITDDASVDDALPAPGQWPIVTSLDAVRAGSHFAWGDELDAVGAVDGGDGLDMADRVAIWTALIDAGARVLITRHEPEAKRVATLVSDLLALQASPASPSSTVGN